MKINETCKCGSIFVLECSEEVTTWAANRIQEFQTLHLVCLQESVKGVE